MRFGGEQLYVPKSLSRRGCNIDVGCFQSLEVYYNTAHRGRLRLAISKPLCSLVFRAWLALADCPCLPYLA